MKKKTAKIQIPDEVLPLVRELAKSKKISLKKAFLFLMGYNTPQKKDNVTDNSHMAIFNHTGYNTPELSVKRIIIVEIA